MVNSIIVLHIAHWCYKGLYITVQKKHINIASLQKHVQEWGKHIDTIVPIIFHWIHLLNPITCGLIDCYVNIWNCDVVICLKMRQRLVLIDVIVCVQMNDVIYNWLSSNVVNDTRMPQLKRCLAPLCGEAVVVPLVNKFSHCLLNSWQINIMQTKKMKFIQWIKKTFFLHKVKNVDEMSANNSIEFSPQSFNSLVMDWNTCNYAVQSPSFQHKTCNKYIFHAMITSDPCRQTKVVNTL